MFASVSPCRALPSTGTVGCAYGHEHGLGRRLGRRPATPSGTFFWCIFHAYRRVRLCGAPSMHELDHETHQGASFADRLIVIRLLTCDGYLLSLLMLSFRSAAMIHAMKEDTSAQVEMATSRLKMAVASKVTCEAAQAAIEGFQSSIEPLELNIKDARDRSEDARDALDQAEDTVINLEETLAEQESATAKAQETAEARSDEMKKAKQHLAEVNALKFIVKTRMKVLKKKMDKAKQSLTHFNEAEHAAQQLKLYVQKAMLSMDLYFEMAVREPLRNMMLGGNWEDAFKKTSTADAATGNLEKSIKALDSYCRKTAKPAFALMDKSIADLTPICEFGEVRPVVDNLKEVVDARRTEVMRQLTLATAWLNKFHGQPGMTQELADQYVNRGEPKGLREIIGSLNVKGYLYDWRADGPFLDSLHRLGAHIEEQAQISADLQDSLMGLTSKLRETETERAAAKVALKAAISSEKVAHAEKEEAEEILASQTRETEEANTRLDELQAAADAAWKKFQEAKVSLIKAFKSGTTQSLLQKAEKLM